MQTIDDIVSTGYSNLEAEQGSSTSGEDNKETQATPAPADDAGKTTKESGTLENTETDHDDEEDSIDEESESDDQGQEEKGKRSKGIEKRIKKLTRRQAELQKEAAYWREQALRQQSQQPQGQDLARAEQNRGPENDGKPDPNQFETIAEYNEALVDWRFKQLEKAEMQKSQAQKFQQKVQKHEERVNEFKAQAPDYDLVVQEFQASYPGVSITQDLADMVMESELSAPLAYELFKNPDLLIRINSLPPAQVARELGRLESRIERTIEEKKKLSQTKKTTSAPPPIEPLNQSNARAATQKSINDMTPDEYLEWRRSNRG